MLQIYFQDLKKMLKKKVGNFLDWTIFLIMNLRILLLKKKVDVCLDLREGTQVDGSLHALNKYAFFHEKAGYSKESHRL